MLMSLPEKMMVFMNESNDLIDKVQEADISLNGTSQMSTLLVMPW